MTVILRPEWTRQPQGPVSLASNALTRDIIYCFPFNGRDEEIVTGALVTRATNGTFAPDIRGLSLRSTGSASCASIPLDLSRWNALTVSFWLYWDTFANDDDLAFEFTPNFNTTVGSILVDPNAANGRWQFATRMTGVSSSAASFTRPSGAQWAHYALTIDRRAASASAGLRAIVNGVAQTLIIDNTTAGNSSNFANSTLYLFSRNNTSLFGAGRLQNLVFRAGITSDSLLLDEYRNSWKLYAPRRSIIPVSVAGGGSKTSTGALSSDAATVSGTATRLALHTATGALAAESATVAGSALHPHTSTGALSADAATVAGTATRLALHTSSGALAAGDATVAGDAEHTADGVFDAVGILSAEAAAVVGAAQRFALHTSTGTIAAGAATVDGAAAHVHASEGAIAAGAATVAGTAARVAAGEFSAVGSLSAEAATVIGEAQHISVQTPTLVAPRRQIDALRIRRDDDDVIMAVAEFMAATRNFR